MHRLNTITFETQLNVQSHQRENTMYTQALWLSPAPFPCTSSSQTDISRRDNISKLSLRHISFTHQVHMTIFTCYYKGTYPLHFKQPRKYLQAIIKAYIVNEVKDSLPRHIIKQLFQIVICQNSNLNYHFGKYARLRLCAYIIFCVLACRYIPTLSHTIIVVDPDMY